MDRRLDQLPDSTGGPAESGPATGVGTAAKNPTLKELIETGTITLVIDRTYSLSETPEAIRYLEKGHTRGKSSSPCLGRQGDERTCDLAIEASGLVGCTPSGTALSTSSAGAHKVTKRSSP